MKILIEGDLNRLRRTRVFWCKNCGCEFEATREEYKENQIEGVYCRCPCCGRETNYLV